MNTKTIIEKYGSRSGDSGSTKVQVAILHYRILSLTEHCKVHRGDNHSIRGLKNLVSKQKRLLKYLINKEGYESYVVFARDLGLKVMKL